jgi:hypothetical protein
MRGQLGGRRRPDPRRRAIPSGVLATALLLAVGASFATTALAQDLPLADPK